MQPCHNLEDNTDPDVENLPGSYNSDGHGTTFLSGFPPPILR